MGAEATRVLILGGTGEAAALATALDPHAEFEVVSSLAGRTRGGRDLPGEIRLGGFGGAEGLAAYLESARIDLLVDATHPYARRITRNAVQAAQAAKVPRLRLTRPPWRREPGDLWHLVPDVEAAAAALAGHGPNVFLTIGRQELAPFAACTAHRFLLRVVEKPVAPLPLAACELLVARGPFAESEERELLLRHRIDVLVSKNSGGAATYGKIAAARALELPVVMVERPPEPEGDSVSDLQGALDWIEAHRVAAG